MIMPVVLSDADVQAAVTQVVKRFAADTARQQKVIEANGEKLNNVQAVVSALTGLAADNADDNQDLAVFLCELTYWVCTKPWEKTAAPKHTCFDGVPMVQQFSLALLTEAVEIASKRQTESN